MQSLAVPGCWGGAGELHLCIFSGGGRGSGHCTNSSLKQTATNMSFFFFFLTLPLALAEAAKEGSLPPAR